ncbi:MAG: DUF47 family protein, partial [Chloroflexota bacterium]|nr:DUF47 family protein [Chloroflexota bacterium]
MGWVQNLFKRSRQDRFIQLLIQQADYSVKGADALLEYLKKPSKKHADKVTRIEKEADEIRRILIAELNNTFVTPLDREDIHALSRAIDDVLDYAFSTVDEMYILEVQPNEYLHRMVSMLGDAAREIHLGVQRLQDHPAVADN